MIFRFTNIRKKAAIKPEPFDLPIFPLNSVLFPGSVLSLKIFEQRYKDMTKDCLDQQRPFGICLIKESSAEGVTLTESIGCTAKIAEWEWQETTATANLKVLGVQRFRILATNITDKGWIQAKAQAIAPDPSIAIPVADVSCVLLLQMMISQLEPGKIALPYDFENATWVGNRLSEVLPVPLIAKQKLLEMTDSLSRLDTIHKYLTQQGLLK